MSEDLTQKLPNNDMKLILTRLDSIDSRLGGVDSRLSAMDSRLDTMDSQLSSLDSRLGGIDSRLTTLEDKVDKRLQETRPIWERALAEIAETRTELAETRVEMREGLEKLRDDMEMGFHRVAGQIDTLNHNILDVRTDIRFLDKRVSKLESEPAQ